MKSPKRKTALICLILFIVGIIGYFVPLHGIPIVGSFVNNYAIYLLMGGYGVLLAAIYIL